MNEVTLKVRFVEIVTQPGRPDKIQIEIEGPSAFPAVSKACPKIVIETAERSGCRLANELGFAIDRLSSLPA